MKVHETGSRAACGMSGGEDRMRSGRSLFAREQSKAEGKMRDAQFCAQNQRGQKKRSFGLRRVVEILNECTRESEKTF